VNVRPREAADEAAAQAFLARHNSLRVARLGELVHPLNYPAFVAETAGGQLLGMLTYVPGQDWRQCEILTLHAGEQWHGAGTALIEAVGQLARRQGCSRLWVITINDNVDALRF
jgi:GNAT superfamily N-acetyltransferase